MRKRITHANDKASARLLLQCLPVARIIVKHSRAHEIKFVQLTIAQHRIDHFVLKTSFIFHATFSLFLLELYPKKKVKKKK